MSFRSEANKAARLAGGSFGTIATRCQIIGQLADYLQRQNIQIRDLSALKAKYVAAWLGTSKEAGLSARTCQNRATAVRATLRAAGLTGKARAIVNAKALGIAGASRNGSRVAIKADEYKERVDKVADEGVRAVLELQRHLGLRQLEGIRAQADTLRRWERELQINSRIGIYEGTKGGRPRQCLPIDRAAALSSVRSALDIVGRQNGRLIDKPELKSAVDRYNNVARSAGFIGQKSPHSIRYAWAVASIRRYLDAGLTRREALIATSQDLGHGDGRGRWVNQVYSRE